MKAKSALDHAREHIKKGIRETHGKNRSPYLDDLARRFGVPLGSPYCAMFVSDCMRLAGAGPANFPKTAGSQAILSWARLKNRSFTDPDRLLRCTGALFGWTNPDGKFGHVGFVDGRLTDAAGKVVAIRTAEANTSPQTKDRDGEGAFHLKRTVLELQQRRYWFVDLTEIPGGAFWDQAPAVAPKAVPCPHCGGRGTVTA